MPLKQKKTALLPRLVCLLCALLLALPAAAEEEALYQASLTLLDSLRAGEEEKALAMMDETMRAALSGQIAGLWEGLTLSAGEFEGPGAYEFSRQDGYQIVLLELRFSKATLVQRVVFDASGLVAGLFFAPGAVAAPPQKQAEPEDGQYTEIPLTVDAGAGYPLEGLLTLPGGEVKAAVVLVQGSGPSDRDERVLANAPFLDLAHGLAQRGIATLRYDKRSYVYGAKMAEEIGTQNITVREETVDDAAAALRLARERAELQGKPVFLLGHSLGGMLASYIGSLAGAPDGYILLAGSPRKLWQLSESQNLLMLSELASGCKKVEADQAREMIGIEQRKARQLDRLDDTQTLFGLPLPYLRQLEEIDAAALHLSDQKPVLVLQGEEDRQVTMSDFEAWRERLCGHPRARFVSFPGLNHLFGRYEGEKLPFSRLMEEYAVRTPVDPQVMDEIADFIAGSQ